MTRKTGEKHCRVCGAPSGNQNVCVACKVAEPFVPSGRGGAPFKRKRRLQP